MEATIAVMIITLLCILSYSFHSRFKPLRVISIIFRILLLVALYMHMHLKSLKENLEKEAVNVVNNYHNDGIE